MNVEYELVQLKKELEDVKKEQRFLDKQIEKQEEDGNFDNDLYARMSELEDKRNQIMMQIEALDK